MSTGWTKKKFEAAEAILNPPDSTPERANNLNSTFLLLSIIAEYY